MKRLVLSLLFLWIGIVLFAQKEEASFPSIHFHLHALDFQKLVESKGQKFEIKPIQAQLNDKEIQIEKIRIRGKSSLHFSRKSFSIHLSKNSELKFSSSSKAFRKFYLMSLSMDKFDYYNRLAFQCMAEIGIFPLDYRYAQLKINEEDQGTYFFVEKPDEYVLKEIEGRFIMRRGAYSQADDIELAKGLSKAEAKSYQKKYLEIKRICKQYEGKDLVERLSALIDLPAYMKWLAFNYWINNGDYNDEVFFYVKEENAVPLFSILPWDYDDIFADGPHEGWSIRNKRIKDALIFSSEDYLGRKIATDSVLYADYLKILDEVIAVLSEEKLKGIFGEIREELKALDRQQNGDQMIGRLQDLEEKFEFMLAKRAEMQLMMKK
ncbi:MAG: CotH kinase family protein [Bacteroidota bacterium]